MSLPSGSKWMSETPSSTPLAITPLTSLMTGASPADSRISVTSPLGGALLVLLDRLCDRGVELACVVERGLDVLGGGDRRPDVEPGHDRDVVDRADVGRVGHRDHQRVLADERDRDRAVALRRLGGNQVDRAEVDVEGAQVEVVEAEALGRRPRELVGGDHLFGEQDLLRGATAVAGLGDRGLDPLLGAKPSSMM